MPNAQPNQATMDLLRSVRAKAEDLLAQDPNHPEGLIFQEKYLKLLAKYSLDDAALTTDTDTEPVVSVRYAHPARTWAIKRAHMIHHVCYIFELPHNTIKLRGPVWEMLICGRSTTIEAVIAICEYLLPQMERFIIAVAASDEYQDLHGNARAQFASDAIDSWIARIAGRLAVLHAEAKAETDTPDPDATALVLADHFTQANSLMEQRLAQLDQEEGLKKGRNLPALGYRSETAHHMGTAAADSADLGQARINDTPPHRPALRSR